MTILELFRKVFGCFSDDDTYIEITDDDHVLKIDNLTDAYNNKEKSEVIGNIVSAVIDEKEKSFVSYTEEAMDEVTAGKFKFKKYRK